MLTLAMTVEGSAVAEASRKTSVAEETLYGWRPEYRGLRVNEAGGLSSWSRRTRGSEERWPTGREYLNRFLGARD